jgi:hypothetical protein
MLLHHLKHEEASALVEAGVAMDLSRRSESGVRTTAQIGDAIAANIAAAR